MKQHLPPFPNNRVLGTRHPLSFSFPLLSLGVSRYIRSTPETPVSKILASELKRRKETYSIFQNIFHHVLSHWNPQLEGHRLPDAAGYRAPRLWHAEHEGPECTSLQGTFFFMDRIHSAPPTFFTVGHTASRRLPEAQAR